MKLISVISFIFLFAGVGFSKDQAKTQATDLTREFLELDGREQAAILGTVTGENLWNIQELIGVGNPDDRHLNVIASSFRSLDLSDQPSGLPATVREYIKPVGMKAYAMVSACDDSLSEELGLPIEEIEYSCMTDSFLVYDVNAVVVGAVIRIVNHLNTDDHLDNRMVVSFTNPSATIELHRESRP